MKAFAAIMMGMALALTALGCTKAASTEATAIRQTISATPGPTNTPSASAAKDYDDIGSSLMASESIGGVHLGMKLSDLTALLGQPESKTAPELWGSDGLEHTTYTFDKKGFSIDMVREPDSKEDPVVFSISAIGPCKAETSRGIKLGDSSDAVMRAYADAVDLKTNPQKDGSIVAGSIYGGIVFTIAKGKVTEIFIGASVE